METRTYPLPTDAQRLAQKARMRAYRRLAAMHPAGFDRMLDEERGKVGLPPRKQQRDACHGTRSGYEKHRRLGEEACRDCKDAQRDYARERADRKRTTPA